MSLKEETLETKYPELSDCGLAYHIMMFINREETSLHHTIGDDFLWESMAEKKMFRGKTAESLKTFFREDFWGNYKKFGISKNTYKILLEKLKINYLETNKERLELVKKLFCTSNTSFSLEEISSREFWQTIFFLNPLLFDPFSCWDKNLAEYQDCLRSMPQLLKRKSTCSKTVSGGLNEPKKETEVAMPATVDILAKKYTADGASVCQEFKEASSPQQMGSGLPATNMNLEISGKQSASSEIEEMDVYESIKSEEELESNEKETLDRNEEKTETSVAKPDLPIKPGTDIQLTPTSEKQSIPTDSYRNEVTKNVALPSAMSLLAAKREKSVMVLYNHASTFFSVLTLMVKSAQLLAIDENLVADDWHLLSDDDARKQFEKLAVLDVITNDPRLEDFTAAFIRLCVSFGRLLQFEQKQLNVKKKQQTLTGENEKRE